MRGFALFANAGQSVGLRWLKRSQSKADRHSKCHLRLSSATHPLKRVPELIIFHCQSGETHMVITRSKSICPNWRMAPDLDRSNLSFGTVQKCGQKQKFPRFALLANSERALLYTQIPHVPAW